MMSFSKGKSFLMFPSFHETMAIFGDQHNNLESSRVIKKQNGNTNKVLHHLKRKQILKF